jgi:hypothetical protein
MRTRAIKPIQTAKNVENVLSSTDEEQQPLSPMARMFHEPDSNVYIIIIIGFQTKINPEVMRANVGNTLLKHPRFSSLQASSVFFFIHKSISLKYYKQFHWFRDKEHALIVRVFCHLFLLEFNFIVFLYTNN